MSEETEIEINIAKEDKATEAGVLRLGDPSLYACPECHGVLLRVKEGTPERFRCHTGHAYTLNSLLSEMDEKIEETLWGAIRAIEERVMLTEHMADHLRETDGGQGVEKIIEQAEAAKHRAHLVRQAVLGEGAKESRAGDGAET